jgi:LPXTG-site transpeptidase (sortase) family protein
MKKVGFLNIGSVAVLVLSVSVFLLAPVASVVTAEALSPGTLDPTFGNNGIVMEDFGAGNASGKEVLIQPDGKIVLAGETYDSSVFTHDFSLVRFNADGSPDTSFGTGGMAIADSGSSVQDYGMGAALQADGKVVVVGYSGSYPDIEMAVARFNANGSLDTSFATGGWYISNFPYCAYAYDVAIQSDGKIVVSGEVQDGSEAGDFAVWRFNANGTLDAGFGTGGVVTTDFNEFYESAIGVVIQADGKIVAVGGVGNEDEDYFYIAMARYTANGSLDATFDGDGMLTSSPTGNDFEWGSDIAVKADGKLIVFGSGYGSNQDFLITRYNANGSLDTTFGSSGGYTLTDISGDDSSQRLAMQPDDKIVAAGYSSSGPMSAFSLARFNADGSLDTGFGTGGSTTTAVGVDNAYARGVALQADGKIVLGGSALPEGSIIQTYAAARYGSGLTVNNSGDSGSGDGGNEEAGDLQICPVGVPGGGCSASGVSVSVPSTAVPDGSQVIITQSATGNFSLGGVVYDIKVIGPDGNEIHVFDPPLEICLTPGTDLLNTVGWQLSKLTMFHNHSGDNWQPLYASYVKNGMVCAKTWQLSEFALGQSSLPNTGFAPGVVQTLPPQPIQKAYSETGSMALEIPRIGVKMPIVGVPFTDTGFDVTWLGQQAGWLDGTAFPTWEGNSVITGHVYDANGQPGPFANLRTLWYGDQIVIRAWGQRYIYAVRSVQQIQPDNLQPFQHEEDLSWLTLITCRGYDEESGEYRYRTVVRAVRVE